MRLKKSDQAKIIQTLKGLLPRESQVYLFGSRVREETRGGDIDLLCILPSSQDIRPIKSQKNQILESLKHEIGDRRIDLRICVESDFDDDPFLQSIRSTMVELKS